VVKDYRQYYCLESFLSDTVRPRFLARHFLSVEDFFCILIWKANRSKTNHASRLKERAGGDLARAVYELTSALFEKTERKDRLRVLIQDWGFWLPTASAILTVLHPDDFTVYDERVCDVLNNFRYVNQTTVFEKIWDGYEKYQKSAEEVAPKGLTLRDKDRYLWGKSFHAQLISDTELGFPKKSSIGPQENV